ncbi:MAG: hypothetical protein KDE35_15655 [Geminicoccaceae bacterium]|nr:hypothetical protein [Geminicoccaceae bacterium]
MTPIEAGRVLDLMARTMVEDGTAASYSEGFERARWMAPGIAGIYSAPALPLSLPAAPGRSRPPKTVADPGDEIDALAVELVETGRVENYDQALHQVVNDPQHRHTVEAWSRPGGS